MILSPEEKDVARSIQPEQLKLIEKYFIRGFEHLPSDYRAVANEQLGEQVKAHLTARDLNVSYLNELKKSVSPDGGPASPVAPD